MVVAHRVERDGRDEVDEHQCPADVLVRRQCLDEHRQDREREHLDRRRQHVPVQVLRQFDGGVALDELDGHCADNGDGQRGEEHTDHSQGLRQHEGPVRYRTRIDDLVDAHVAVPPDELTPVEDGDHERNDRECALQQLQHREGPREGRRAVEAGRERERRDRIEQAEGDQDEKRRAEEDLTHLVSRADDKAGRCKTLDGRCRQGIHAQG